MTKFKCGFIVIVAALCLAGAIFAWTCAKPLLAVVTLAIVLISSAWVECVRLALRLCFLSPIFRRCLLQSNRWLSTSFLYIHYYSSLSFRQSWCFCRVVLLFFSFLLFSRGRNGNACIESIQISLLFRYYSRCVFSLIPTRRSDREKQESQQRKTRETKNTSHRHNAAPHHMHVVRTPGSKHSKFSIHFFAGTLSIGR